MKTEKKVTEKITNCTICNELSLVKKYLDEWLCSRCISKVCGMKDQGKGLDRIHQLRRSLGHVN